jgi:hypothetical protein
VAKKRRTACGLIVPREYRRQDRRISWAGSSSDHSEGCSQRAVMVTGAHPPPEGNQRPVTEGHHAGAGLADGQAQHATGDVNIGGRDGSQLTAAHPAVSEQREDGAGPSILTGAVSMASTCSTVGVD